MNKKFTGGKSAGLQWLKEHHYDVPDFFDIKWDDLKPAIVEFVKEAQKIISGKKISDNHEETARELAATIAKKENLINTNKLSALPFPRGPGFYAVRSSASVEDGIAHSFAGLFQTHLYVKKELLPQRVRDIVLATYSERVLYYCLLKKINIKTLQPGMLVQQMVYAQTSGVIFTRNPTANLNEMVINAGMGLGPGVVDGTVETDDIFCDRQSGTIRINSRHKTKRVFYDEEKDAIEIQQLPEPVVNPALTKEQYSFLFESAKKMEQALGSAVDVEFSIDKAGKIWFLQVRPVTGLKPATWKIYDNSNIAESYPGITLPLSAGFAKQGYKFVFRGAAGAFGISEKIVNKNDLLFANLIEHINGRVYYQLHNWYRMMALILPSKRSLQQWEENLGISQGESGELAVSFTGRLKALAVIIRLFVGWKTQNRAFYEFFDPHYRQLLQTDLSLPSSALFAAYKEKADLLFSRWYPTLVNDFFAFKAYNMLNEWMTPLKKELPTVTNDLLCGMVDVESEETLLLLLIMAEASGKDPELDKLFIAKDYKKVLQFTEANSTADFSQRFKEYLSRFPDRVLEELKLETPRLDWEPLRLIAMIDQHRQNGQTVLELKKRQIQIRTNAEVLLSGWHKGFIRKKMISYVLQKTRYGLANRENMRLCRSRIYGAAKRIFRQIGENMQEEGILNQGSDIFWLKLEEVNKYCTGDKTSLKACIEDRKREAEHWKNIEMPDRLILSNSFSSYKPEGEDAIMNAGDGFLRGTTVSGGNVKGEALVLDSPGESIAVAGKILVTKTTDPGWIFLMGRAAGLISEKGSLLSHTAIVGRELGIPTLVGVSGATRIINTGDTLHLMADEGKVKIS